MRRRPRSPRPNSRCIPQKTQGESMTITRSALGVLTLASIAVLLAGCAGSGGTTSTSKTLSVSGNSSERAGLDAAVKDFEAANPGVTVTAKYSADPQSSVPTQFSAGTAADVVWLNQGQQGAASVGGAAKDGYLLDVSSEAWAKKQPSNSINKYAGKVWSASVDIAGIGVAWDQTTLDSVGAKVPTTLTELL